jgi:hypothetical protein
MRLDDIPLVAYFDPLFTSVHSLPDPLSQAHIKYLKELLSRYDTKTIPVPTKKHIEQSEPLLYPLFYQNKRKIGRAHTSPQTHEPTSDYPLSHPETRCKGL